MKSLFLPEWQAFLRYEDLAGASPARVYLSGLLMASHATFAAIVAGHPALRPRRSVFVDYLGCGFSDRPEDFGYSLEEHAGTVATLLDELGLAGCEVVGFSMGGAVAITLAATRPDLVSRLVLMEANLDPGGGEFSGGVAQQPEDEFCASGYRALLESIRPAALAGDEQWATIAGLFQTAAPHALHRSAVGLVEGTQPTMRERLLELDIPRAYIFGEQSLPDPDWDALAGQGIQVLSVPEAGHGMIWENPTGVAEALATAFTGGPR